MTINDTDPSVIYSTIGSGGTGPTWFTASDPTDYMNDEHYSNFSFSPAFQVNGADLVVNFTGTDVTWIGKIGPNFGIASYSVDGGPPATFDAYHASVVSQNNNVVISGLAPGSHSLKIEVTQTKNASSSDHYQTIDAFNCDGAVIRDDRGSAADPDDPLELPRQPNAEIDVSATSARHSPAPSSTTAGCESVGHRSSDRLQSRATSAGSPGS
jgi:hypothetical protein